MMSEGESLPMTIKNRLSGEHNFNVVQFNGKKKDSTFDGINSLLLNILLPQVENRQYKLL